MGPWDFPLSTSSIILPFFFLGSAVDHLFTKRGQVPLRISRFFSPRIDFFAPLLMFFIQVSRSSPVPTRPVLFVLCGLWSCSSRQWYPAQRFSFFFFTAELSELFTPTRPLWCATAFLRWVLLPQKVSRLHAGRTLFIGPDPSRGAGRPNHDFDIHQAMSEIPTLPPIWVRLTLLGGVP